MDAVDLLTTLDALPVGCRLIVRSRSDWRFAAVSRVGEEKIVLTVCSPSGRTYRLRRGHKDEVDVAGKVPVLIHSESEDWRQNCCTYDLRW